MKGTAIRLCPFYCHAVRRSRLECTRFRRKIGCWIRMLQDHTSEPFRKDLNARDGDDSRGDAYASWQKGGVENANRRLRRRLPRWLDLDTLSKADLQDAIVSLNTTPRKCSASSTLSSTSSKNLARTSESASREHVALHAGIYQVPPAITLSGPP